MYNLEIDDLSKLEVKSRKHSFRYSIDASAPNPIEATYAALAGCAGVYTLKACKKLQISPLGIKISGKPYLDNSNPLMITKWVTQIQFPQHISVEHRAIIKNEVQKCAVKEMILNGSGIEFNTEDVPFESLASL